jgi:ATP-dependent helicase/nuclease subunit A
VFFTKSGSPAKLGGVASKTVQERFPDLADRVAEAQAQVVAIFDRLARLRMLAASLTAFPAGAALSRRVRTAENPAGPA